MENRFFVTAHDEFVDALGAPGTNYVELGDDMDSHAATARALAFALNHIDDPAVIDAALEIFEEI